MADMTSSIVNKSVAAAVFFILIGSVVVTQYQDARSAVNSTEVKAFLLLAMLLFVIGVALKFHD